MKKIYLLLFLVTGFVFGQVKIVGTANYELKLSNGYVGFWGSSCGDDITGGLQWIAAEYDSPKSFSTMIQGTASYPNNGNGLANQSFGPKNILFTEANKIINLKIGTTHRDRGTTGCKSTDYNTITIPLTTNFYTKFDQTNLVMNQPINVLVTVSPIIDLINTVPEEDIIGTKSSIIIPTITGVLKDYYNWMYHIEGDVIAYTVYVPDPDPDCGSGSPILLKASAKIIDPDNPPVECPDIPVTKYKDRWIPLPQAYQNENSLNIKCKDFLPFSVVGKKVQLRVNDNGKDVELRYRLSAPVVESFVASDSKCYGDNESGSVRFVFDDILMPGEQLNYTLIDVGAGNTPTSYSGPIVIANDRSFVIPNLRRGQYELQLVGFKDGLITNVDTNRFPLQRFEIGSPTPVDFQLSKTDVKCNGGTDGTITINASGGTLKGYQYSINDGSWILFKNTESSTETIPALSPNPYTIRVKDANECIAKVQTMVDGKIELGAELSKSITILQPATAISLTNTSPFLQQPTFHSAVNGSITASFTGGTPVGGNSYIFEWVNANYSTAELAAKTSTQFRNGIYSITLKDVPAGTYNLTVTDANGCILNPVLQPKLSIVLSEPDPIQIQLAIIKPISCNTDNFDPITGNALKLADGKITATVTGGTPLSVNENHGLLYFYTWKKQLPDNSWIALEESESFLENLSEANYSLNVTDKNGVTQGTYSTTDLILAISTEKKLVEPDPLSLTFIPTPISCFNGNNGSVIANVTGGTGMYSYKWSTNATTQSITGLDANDGNVYNVTITDSKGCTTSDGILITQPPSQVSLNYIIIDNPKFSGATNGKIVVEVTGGTPNVIGNAYSYKWTNKKGDIQEVTSQTINGIFTIMLDGLPADDYFLTVWDKNYNVATNQVENCSIIDSKISLSEPDPLVVTFEIKQTISCNVSNDYGNDKDTTPKDGQRDESQDGILIAHVKGGTPLTPSANNGLPYYFYWKKQQADGTWITWNENDETAENLSHGNYALNIKDRNGIILGTYVNNILTNPVDVTQFMKEPPKFSATISKGDVFCNNGNDGWATANLTGGTQPYQYNWSNGETIPDNTFLSAGRYLVKSIDVRGCATQESIVIKEPLESITLNYTEVTNPTFYKATNGKIVVEVKGGTIFPDNTYWYEWKNSKGITQTTTTGEFNNGTYVITLKELPEDTYTLTIRDANYNLATNKMGCTIINSQKALDDPDPLDVTFEVVRTISCNVRNEFGNETDASPLDNQRDESQDGILVAHAKGGIPLPSNKNNGLPYFYTWKKLQKDGSWTIWNDHDEKAEYLSEGTYALNIEDANGIKLGTYVNNVLAEEKDVIKYMPEPAKLSLAFTKFDVGCATGDDGWAEAHVSGGTSPYSYEWTNGESREKIENLTTNNYFVITTDAKGCIIQGSIFVGDPNGVFAAEEIKNPICFKGNNGSIKLNVTGGNLPYSYLWNTGSTIKDLNNLAAGNYEVAITCPDCCVYKKKFVLKDPEPVIVAVGPDRTLCIDQSLNLDASITDPKAQYSWSSTNGFTSSEANINVSKDGTYHVKVTSSIGCIGEDEIVIKTSQTAISSEFLLSSQAYLDEEVILINTSNPFGETTNWVIPKGVKVVEQKEKYITLKFDEVGTYTIGLQQTQGECYAVFNKNITVEKRSTQPNAVVTSKFITGFIVTPNPSNGNFKALINLENDSAINLRLFSSSGQFTAIQKKDSGKKKYEIDFNTSLQSGTYILVLETEQQTLVKKIIIY